jgi:hypothetical protein
MQPQEKSLSAHAYSLNTFIGNYRIMNSNNNNQNKIVNSLTFERRTKYQICNASIITCRNIPAGHSINIHFDRRIMS